MGSSPSHRDESTVTAMKVGKGRRRQRRRKSRVTTDRLWQRRQNEENRFEGRDIGKKREGEMRYGTRMGVWGVEKGKTKIRRINNISSRSVRERKKGTASRRKRAGCLFLSTYFPHLILC